MTDQDALSILDQATEPQNAGKITRDGYHKIHSALLHIKERLEWFKQVESGKSGDNAGQEAVQ